MAKPFRTAPPVQPEMGYAEPSRPKEVYVRPPPELGLRDRDACHNATPDIPPRPEKPVTQSDLLDRGGYYETEASADPEYAGTVKPRTPPVPEHDKPATYKPFKLK